MWLIISRAIGGLALQEESFPLIGRDVLQTSCENGEQCLVNLWINYLLESYVGAERQFPSFADITMPLRSFPYYHKYL